MPLPRHTSMRLPTAMAQEYQQRQHTASMRAFDPAATPQDTTPRPHGLPPLAIPSTRTGPTGYVSDALQDSVSVMDAAMGGVPMPGQPPHGHRYHATQIVVEHDGAIVPLSQYEADERRRQEMEQAAAQSRGADASGYGQWLSGQDDAKDYEPVVEWTLFYARVILRMVSGFTAGFSMMLLIVVTLYTPMSPVQLTPAAQSAFGDLLKQRQQLANASSARTGGQNGTTAGAGTSGGVQLGADNKLLLALNYTIYVDDATAGGIITVGDIYNAMPAATRSYPLINSTAFLRAYAPVYKELSLAYMIVSMICVVLALYPLAHALALNSRAALAQRRVASPQQQQQMRDRQNQMQQRAQQPRSVANNLQLQQSPAAAASPKRGEVNVLGAFAPLATIGTNLASYLANFQFIVFTACVILGIIIATVETDRQTPALLLSAPSDMEQRLMWCVIVRSWLFLVGWVLCSWATPSTVASTTPGSGGPELAAPRAIR